MNLPGGRPSANGSLNADSKVEYSGREVCPPALVLQQLLRAHRIFLLHHSPTLAELYARLARPRFCYILKRYWDNYILDWDLLLNGNPAVDVFNGLKLAAGGELGIGVGEEEWGSGEREVLEDFVRRTDGLVDLIVSRFGDSKEAERTLGSESLLHGSPTIKAKTVDECQGVRQHPKPSDGVIFSGIGAITRSSVKDVSSWVELLYKYGQRAYGVQDNPAAVRRKRREKQALDSSKGGPHTKTGPSPQRRKLPNREPFNKVTTSTSGTRSVSPPTIPPPIVRPPYLSAEVTNTSPPVRSSSKGVHQRDVQMEDDSASGTDTLIKYLTLGVYGSTWGIPSRKVSAHEGTPKIRKESEASASSRKADRNTQHLQEHGSSYGHFLIGLQGELEQDVDVADDEGEKKTHAELGSFEDQGRNERGSNERTILRTLQVQRHKQKSTGSSNSVENAGI